MIDKVICVETEEKDKDVNPTSVPPGDGQAAEAGANHVPQPLGKPLGMDMVWGIPEEDLPEQEPEDYFAMKDEQVH